MCTSKHIDLFYSRQFFLDYSDDDMAYEGVDEEEGEKLKLKGEVSDDESTGFIITGIFIFCLFHFLPNSYFFHGLQLYPMTRDVLFMTLVPKVL